ncbi:MAG TPA: glycosyltransferase family 39 protein [Thermoanaerobaculia bacterium]|nr:glycosyltransferase family 39 protein [Thermoanaerobaculia bacterium]
MSARRDDEPRSPLPGWWPWLAIALGALTLRLWGLDARSLWLDEVVSLEVARAPLAAILRGEAFDNHTPPLYYVLLKAWLLLAPATELGLRLPSALLDAANALLLGLLCMRALGAGIATGRTAALVYALSPYAIRLAQEARMYPLLMTCALVAWGATLRYVAERRPGDLVVAALAATAGLYTHYFFAPFLAVLYGWAAVVLYRQRRTPWPWLVQTLAVALAFLAWLPVVLDLLGSGQSFRRYSLAVLPYALVRFASGYGALRLHWRERQSLLDGVLAHWALITIVLVVVTPLLLAALVVAWRRSNATRSLVWLMAGVPLLALVTDRLAPSLSERYLAAVFPSFVALLALLPWGSRGPRGWVALQVLATTLLLCSLVAHLLRPAAGTERWDDAAAAIEAAMPEEAPILVSPGFYRDVAVYHLPQRRIIGLKALRDCKLPSALGRQYPNQATGAFGLLEVEAMSWVARQLADCGYRVERGGHWSDGNGLLFHTVGH